MADATDSSPNIFRRAVEQAEFGRNDRWPARGKAGSRGGDYRPLDTVSREGRPEPYRKYPSAAR
jgi:hypothetical protein